MTFGPHDAIDTTEDIRPDPKFLKIHYAIHKLLIMSGAAEAVWADMINDYDNGGNPSLLASSDDIPYLGHSAIADKMFLDSLSHRLQYA
jgi:hypothetical protein